MTIRSTPKEPTERDGHARFILESHANPGSACNAIPDPAAWLQPAHRPLAERRPAKRPASRDEPQGRRSGTPIHKDHPLVRAGDEPPRQVDRTEPHPPLGSHDPSGSVFSSLVQEQADIRSDDQSCNLMLPSWITHPTILTTQPHRTGVVELVGIEPTTPCLQSRCSPS